MKKDKNKNKKITAQKAADRLYKLLISEKQVHNDNKTWVLTAPFHDDLHFKTKEDLAIHFLDRLLEGKLRLVGHGKTTPIVELRSKNHNIYNLVDTYYRFNVRK